MDTLRGEDIPLCSMLSPITSKILIKKLGIAEQDDPLMMNLKRTISSVLQAHVISNDNLTAAALLDPRFHRLTTIDNLERTVRMLTHKYNINFGGVGEGESNEVAATSSVVAIKSEPRVVDGSAPKKLGKCIELNRLS